MVGPSFEFRRDRCFEAQLFFGKRVLEGKPPGVEHEAGSLCGGFAGFAVDGVAHDGGAFMEEVDADLVGAPGVEVAEHERGDAGGVHRENFVIGDRGFSSGRSDDSHFLAVHRMAPDVGENAVFCRLGDALGDGEVEFLHGAALRELGDQGLVGDIGFRDDKAAGGVFVQAVDDARALDPTDAGKLSMAVVKERIDEGAIGISRRGVDDHAMRFVQDNEVIIFKQNFQSDVLRRGIEWHGLGQNDRDNIAQLHGIAGFGRVAIDLDELLADERLDARAREVRKAGGEKCINALARTVFD